MNIFSLKIKYSMLDRGPWASCMRNSQEGVKIRMRKGKEKKKKKKKKKKKNGEKSKNTVTGKYHQLAFQGVNEGK